MKKTIVIFICLILIFNISACGRQTPAGSPSPSVKTQTEATADIYLDASYTTEQRVSDLLKKMSLEDKAGQMVQGEQYVVTDSDMAARGLGSVLSGGGSVPGNNNTVENWNSVIDGYQAAVLSRNLKIPFIYGADAVHGHNTLYGAVIFPQNIGIGSANDTALTEQMGKFVAEEMKLTGILWNFGPCIAAAQDPRWGRTYESLSSDPEIVGDLAMAYLKGQQQAGVLATAKHYAGDGGAVFNTGEGDFLIDRGDAAMSEGTFRALHLAQYKRLVDEGVQCVMVSFSSYNGLKMHENKYLITDVLKNEFGFKGFVVTDWEGISGINAPSFEARVEACVNAGVDMLMEPYRYNEAIDAIVSGAENGTIAQERIDDAVRRILTVKFDLGLFEDPYLDNADLGIDELGSEQGRELAKKLVEESQVLVKNENGILPLKQGQKIYVTGPAADNIGVQCGGWTITWQGIPDKDLTPGTSLLEGLSAAAGQYGLEIITDKNRAGEADIVLLAVGETPYAEYVGDTADLSLTGSLSLPENAAAIAEAKALGKPIVTVIIAGRNVLIGDYINDWDAVVMSYLPGTEGGGIAAVLTGEAPFTGKLPMPWYKSVDDIGKENPNLLFELGFGLTGK